MFLSVFVSLSHTLFVSLSLSLTSGLYILYILCSDPWDTGWENRMFFLYLYLTLCLSLSLPVFFSLSVSDSISYLVGTYFFGPLWTQDGKVECFSLSLSLSLILSVSLSFFLPASISYQSLRTPGLQDGKVECFFLCLCISLTFLFLSLPVSLCLSDCPRGYQSL